MSIEASLSDSMKLIDVNGNCHPMTKFQVRMMITIGWLAFLLAALMNILFYKVHPSYVDFNPKRFKERCFIYYFGRKKVFFGRGKGIFSYTVSFLFKLFLDKQEDPEDINVMFTRNLKTFR